MIENHLGGFIAKGDPATYFPDLWSWIVYEYNIKSVLDIGCGVGYSVDYFNNLKCNVLGIEGTKQKNPNIIEWDYTVGPFCPKEDYDLAWSCEFVEHVEEKYIENFMSTFKKAKLVFITHAEPGQPGHHHVNCQQSGYWIEKFKINGFELNPKITIKSREISLKNDFYWIDKRGFHLNHFYRSGLVFNRVD